MPQIPLVGVPESPGPLQIGAQRNPGIYAATAAAGEHLGGALEGLGDLGMRIKSVHDDATITKAATTLQAAQMDFQNSLLDPKNPQNGDPSTYSQRWDAIKQKTLDQLSKDPGVQALSPMARTRFMATQQDIIKRSDLEVVHTTREHMIDQAIGINKVDMQSNVMAGNLDGAMKVNDYMEGHGLISHQEAGQNRLELPRNVDLVNLTKLEEMDPVETNGGPQVVLKNLQQTDDKGNFVNWKHLLPDQRQDAEFHAQRSLNIARGKIADDLINDTLGGNPPDRLKVENLAGKGLLTQGEVSRYLKPVKDGDTSQGFADVMDKIGRFDPVNRDIGAQFDIGKGIDALTGTNKETALSAYKLAINAKDPSNPKMTQANEQLNQLVDNGYFGKWKISVPPSTADLKADPNAKPREQYLPNVQEQAMLKRAQVQAAQAAFIANHPDSTPQERANNLITEARKARDGKGAPPANLFLTPQAVPTVPNGR